MVLQKILWIFLASIVIESLQTPAAFAENKILEISNFSHYINSDGLFSVVGEVNNNSTVTIKETKVYATFYGMDGDILATKSVFTLVDTLRPGEKSPFSIMLADQSVTDDIVRYELQAVSSALSEAKPDVLKLKIAENYIESNGNNSQNRYYNLAGEIINYGNAPANGITVVATFYDENRVIYVARSYVERQLKSTESASFNVVVTESVSFNATSVSVNAQSYEYSSIASADDNYYHLTTSEVTSITVLIDSQSYSNGQEISVSGSIVGELTEEYVILIIMDPEGTLFDRQTARISSDGLYETKIKFYSPPEYEGKEFAVKAKYLNNFARTPFLFATN